MSANNGGGNFLKDKYEWLALGVAVAVLALAGVMAVGALGSNPDDVDGASVSLRKPAETGVKAADLSVCENAMKLVRKPPALVAVPEKGGNFLSSELRSFCMHCEKPMPADAKICPACGKEPPSEQQVVRDTDGDGMIDDWETKYGLNPRDPADAQLDKDGDLFTNLEEYEAKTDPTDAKSHPDYLAFLKLDSALKETRLPFFFRSAMKTPNGMKLEFFDPKKRNDYGRPGFLYSVKEGDEIGDTGFVVKSYTEKSRKVKIKGGGGAEKIENVSEVVIVRKRDSKAVTLVLDEKRKAIDVQAHLRFERGAGKEFTVVIGDTIDLNGEKYKVTDIKPVAKGAEVVIEHAVLGKSFTLQALEQ